MVCFLTFVPFVFPWCTCQLVNITATKKIRSLRSFGTFFHIWEGGVQVTFDFNLNYRCFFLFNFFIPQYLKLARTLGALLEIDPVPGCRSMAHLPVEERERLELDRTKVLAFRFSFLFVSSTFTRDVARGGRAWWGVQYFLVSSRRLSSVFAIRLCVVYDRSGDIYLLCLIYPSFFRFQSFNIHFPLTSNHFPFSLSFTFVFFAGCGAHGF